jgi:CRP/FNR family transcriptional regulator
MSVKGRVANALLQLQNKFGCNKDGGLNITLSRQDLAAYTGATYETVFRTLAELAQDHIISTNGKEIAILHQGKLERLAKENGE